MTEWALVTGASGRGGEAMARALHARGRSVVLHHSPRSAANTQTIVHALNAMRAGSALAWACDFVSTVEVPSSIKDLAPTLLVCNASVYQPSKLDDAARARDDMAVHLHAHAALLHALRPSLKSAVAIADIHTQRPRADYVWYTVAKAALEALVLNLAVEWAPHVRCNVVAPGAMPYPLGWTDHDRSARIESSILLKRLGTFDELAQAVVFLGLDATYVTGQVLAVDGGRTRNLP